MHYYQHMHDKERSGNRLLQNETGNNNNTMKDRSQEISSIESLSDVVRNMEYEMEESAKRVEGTFQSRDRKHVPQYKEQSQLHSLIRQRTHSMDLKK